jgi:hypothetical protein
MPGGSITMAAAGASGGEGQVVITSVGPNTITTGTITGPVCAGSTISVPFTANGYYNMSNMFQAQLSDASGSFTMPTYIGFGSSPMPGGFGMIVSNTSYTSSISATIPASTPLGTGYRIRVVASDIATTGSDNGSNLTINTSPSAPTITATNSVCQAGCSVGGGSFSITSTGGSGNTLTYYSDNLGSNPSTIQPGYNQTTAKTIYYANVSPGGCRSTIQSLTTLPGTCTLPADPANPGSNSPQCAANGVTINATGSAPSGETWYWEATAGSTSISSNAATPLLAKNSGTYYIRSQNNATGCWSSGAGSVSVIVNPTPTVSNISGTTTICTGTSTTLNAVSPDPLASFNWYDAATGGNLITSKSPFVTPKLFVNTTYYVEAVSNGCSSIARTPVTVSLNASPSINTQPSATSQSVCVNSNATALSIAATGGGSATITQYAWYKNNTNSNTGGNPVATHTSSSGSDTYTPPSTTPGSGYYYAVVTNSNGCTTPSAVSGLVSINGLPPDPANPTSNAPQCASTGVTLTGSGAVPKGVNWYWQGTNANGTATVSSASTYTAYTGDTYYIRAQDAASLCWSAGSGSVTTSLSPDPTASISGTTGICAGSSATLLFSGPANATVTYKVNNGSNQFIGLDGSGAASLSVSPAVSSTYAITAVAATCTASVSGQNAVVSINQSPTATALASPLYPMAGQEVQTIYLGYSGSAQVDTIIVNATGGTGPYTYSWEKSDCSGIMSTLMDGNTVVTASRYAFAPTSNDICQGNGNNDNVYTFAIRVTDANGCATATPVMKKINVVDPYSGTNVMLCHKVPRSTTTQLLAVNPSLVASHTGHGDYLGNCTTFTGVKLMAASMAPEQHAFIYPNPTNGVFMLELSDIYHEATVSITDLRGKVMLSQLMTKGGAKTVTVDMTPFAKGVYLIQVTGGGFDYRDKIIVQ